MSLKHMREAWGIRSNPFPAGAIGGEDDSSSPYNSDILASDREKFIEKLIVKAALPPGREFGYLWSQGRRDDTGFGKTTLMRRTASEINADFGKNIVSQFGLPPEITLAGVWASMKRTGVTGIYPLLFNAIVYAARPQLEGDTSLIEKCWAAIAERNGIDPTNSARLRTAVSEQVAQYHRTLFPGYPALRADIMVALVSCDPDSILPVLERVSPASRARNGLAYFEAFYSLVRAAEVQHLFVFIDQLEDLATAANVPRATRQREVGRFRDIFAETAGFRGNCHAVFTFHQRAAHALAYFWQAERINPPFSPQDPMSKPAVVVIEGLTSVKQVEQLLATYLDSARDVAAGTADPFEPSTFQIMLDRSDGRIGQLLSEAYTIFDQAAEAQLPSISGDFIVNNLPGQETEAIAAAVSDEDTLDALWNNK